MKKTEEKKQIKAIFIHGNGGSSAMGNWFPYVKTELEKLGVQVIARDFPDAELARIEYWLPFIEELGADENTILIGHSSGAEAAMRFAETNPLLGSVLVSACHTDLGIDTEKQSGYYDHPWDWEAIKNHQKWIIQFASSDDPFIPISEAQFVRDQLKTDYHEFKDKQHFGYPNEMPEFPELVAAIKKHIK